MRFVAAKGIRGLALAWVLTACHEDPVAPLRRPTSAVMATGQSFSGLLNPTTIYLGDVGPGVDYWVQPNAISSNGQWVGGSASPVQLVNRGFVWHAGVIADVGLLTGPQGTGSYATVFDINNSGVAVGTAVYPDDLPCLTSTRAFTWSNGTMSLLPTLPGDCESAAYGINDGGDIVGYSRPLGGVLQPVLWHNGIPQPIGPADNTIGVRISNSGYVLLSFQPPGFACGYVPAFLWKSGQSTALPTSFCAWDVGEDGTVVGNDGGPQQAATWKNGVMTLLTDPSAPGWVLFSKAKSINTAGEILLEGVGVWRQGRVYPLDRDQQFLSSQSLSDARDVVGISLFQSSPYVANHGYLVPYTPNTSDYDFDGLVDATDRCPLVPYPDNADFDQDGIGDICDPTPGADLALTFGATPPPFVLNQQATVQLLESNMGPGTSSAATVTIPPSPGFKFLSASGATCAARCPHSV